jgi:hypothetical protein
VPRTYSCMVEGECRCGQTRPSKWPARANAQANAQAARASNRAIKRASTRASKRASSLRTAWNVNSFVGAPTKLLTLLRWLDRFLRLACWALLVCAWDMPALHCTHAFSGVPTAPAVPLSRPNFPAFCPALPLPPPRPALPLPPPHPRPALPCPACPACPALQAI